MFSPRARGCSGAHGPHRRAYGVFPACAGMFLTFCTSGLVFFPFSPRARGCSDAVFTPAVEGIVFPACAGMFLSPVLRKSSMMSFPRVRGDVPVGKVAAMLGRRFSPRARGCSSPTARDHRPANRFPRVRGDVPESLSVPPMIPSFSPRARGCSYRAQFFVQPPSVFPACAGMFLQSTAPGTSAGGFPRVRGDVPVVVHNNHAAPLFSPRARGCSGLRLRRRTWSRVFPACAGMFRCWQVRNCSARGFPRVRGDVPPPPFFTFHFHLFSPRARGCSGRRKYPSARIVVFPACAGMFLASTAPSEPVDGFPRVRGDVPSRPARSPACLAFSPRARGCSSALNPENRPHSVFPACAGMFPPQKNAPRPPRSFPRVRGDVPRLVWVGVHHRGFSPRARGCSRFILPTILQGTVFPACAGMFLGAVTGSTAEQCFPRVRGDVPIELLGAGCERPFSPRARGCSSKYTPCGRPWTVFPACAGMFRSAAMSNRASSSFPRVRGDVPADKQILEPPQMFSPRARGCSYIPGAKHPAFEVFPACAGMFPAIAVPDSSIRRFPRVRGDVPADQVADQLQSGVFPACAGMFLFQRLLLLDGHCFPRVRGDVPRFNEFAENVKGFSPRARGCSHEDRTLRRGRCVFPACAGMFRWTRKNCGKPTRFPRVRGDVPIGVVSGGSMSPFSPRARGCSRLGHRLARRQRVFPACAGMFPSGPA